MVKATGKYQVLSLLSEILVERQSKDLLSIYNEFKKNGKITCSLSTFYYQFNKLTLSSSPNPPVVPQGSAGGAGSVRPAQGVNPKSEAQKPTGPLLVGLDQPPPPTFGVGVTVNREAVLKALSGVKNKTNGGDQ